MTQLHTLIALRDAVKSRKTQAVTALHRESIKANLYEGLTRSYRPRDADDTETLPTENQNIQVNADTMLNGFVQVVTRDWDLMASVDASNQRAVADVVVPTDGKTSTGEVQTRVVLRQVPATFLLYLARELDDVYTFVSKLPTLDPASRWTYDENVAANVADAVETHRTKKIMRNHVKYEATERHPAQVDTFTEDKVVGYWTLVRRSGALPLERKARLLNRIDTFRLAVKEARERANETEVVDREVTRAVFDYLLGE